MPLRARCVATVALLSIGSLVPSRANASELRVDWRAPPQCPDREEFLAEFTDLTDGATQSTSSVVVEVTRVAGAYRAHVTVRDASGSAERDLESSGCDRLAQSVAVMLALSLPSRAPDTPPRTLSVGASFEGQLQVGALPQPALGFGAAISVGELLSLRLELHGAYFLTQSESFQGLSPLGADFRLLMFGACVCRLWSFGRLSLGPCLGAQIYIVEASGVGGMPSSSGVTRFWGPSLRLLGQLLLVGQTVGIRLVVEGTVPTTRPRFVFPDAGELHQVSPVALQIVVGPEVRL